MKQLHVYGQEQQHEEVYILGTKEALIALKTAIDKVIQTDKPGLAAAFTTDGEGFYTIVKQIDSEGMKDYCLPYTDIHMKSKAGKYPGSDADCIKLIILKHMEFDLHYNGKASPPFKYWLDRKIFAIEDARAIIDIWEKRPKDLEKTLQEFLGVTDDEYLKILTM